MDFHTSDKVRNGSTRTQFEIPLPTADRFILLIAAATSQVTASSITTKYWYFGRKLLIHFVESVVLGPQTQ